MEQIPFAFWPEALRITRDLKTFRDGLRAYFSL